MLRTDLTRLAFELIHSSRYLTEQLVAGHTPGQNSKEIGPGDL